jgi:hypothetical protein
MAPDSQHCLEVIFKSRFTPFFSLFQLRHAEASICGRAQGDPGQRQERVRPGRRGGNPSLHRQELGEAPPPPCFFSSSSAYD